MDTTDPQICFESAGTPRLDDGEIEAGENPTCVLGEDAPCFGRAHDPARALEEREAKIVFELSDRLRQRRLSHVQRLGCAAEVQLLEDREEVPQMSDLDAGRGAEAAGRGRSSCDTDLSVA